MFFRSVSVVLLKNKPPISKIENQTQKKTNPATLKIRLSLFSRKTNPPTSKKNINKNHKVSTTNSQKYNFYIPQVDIQFCKLQGFLWKKSFAVKGNGCVEVNIWFSKSDPQNCLLFLWSCANSMSVVVLWGFCRNASLVGDTKNTVSENEFLDPTLV